MASDAEPNTPTGPAKQETPPTPCGLPAPSGVRYRHHNDRAIPLMAMLGLALAAIAGAELLTPNPASARGELLRGLNPNTAHWWELVALPEIGPTLAGEITRYRDAVRSQSTNPLAGPVFRTATDLAKVRGIGPKTVARIAPHLRFDSHRDDAAGFED